MGYKIGPVQVYDKAHLLVYIVEDYDYYYLLFIMIIFDTVYHSILINHELDPPGIGDLRPSLSVVFLPLQ